MSLEASLALPRELREAPEINNLAGSLGKVTPIDLQCVSDRPPKPTGPPDKRNAAPTRHRDGAKIGSEKKRAASEAEKYEADASPSTGSRTGPRKKSALWDDVKRKFAGETSAKLLEHHKIALNHASDDRFAWDDRQEGRRRRRVSPRSAVRLRELERFFRYRYGDILPDDDAGRDDLLVAAHHIATTYRAPDRHIRAWASLWAPWLTEDELAALVRQVIQNPITWRADTLAWRIGLTDAVRTLLRITTIGAIDCNKDQRQQRRQQKKNAGKIARRREAGAISRPEYEAASAAQNEPWKALGMSRATWYRRGKPGQAPSGTGPKATDADAVADASETIARETGPGAADVETMLGPHLSHEYSDTAPGTRVRGTLSASKRKFR